MQKNKLKIPVQLIAELNYSPSMETYFKLKLHNKSGHYKHISTKYKQIAIDLKISESSLRKHVNLLQENGFVRLEKNKLVLVSIWRNPIINKDRKHTAAHYQQITKVKIDPTQLKLEMAKIKLLTQLKRQKYKAKKAAKKIFKKDSVKNKAKELVSELAQNGEFKNIRERIYADDSIINKEQEIDNIIGGIKLVSVAVAAYKQSHEGKAIAKSQSISQTRIAELLGVKSTNTVRKRLNLLESNGVLSKERDAVRMIKYKKFNPNKHFYDKFGNFYNKECFRYSIVLKPLKKEAVLFML